jgi:hypothetical protein
MAAHTAAMRSPAIAALVIASAFASAPARAADTANATVVAKAQLNARTSLKVSSELLHFDVTEPGKPVVVAIDYVAAARTQAGGEVILTVEAVCGLDAPPVTFTGEGDGAASGLMTSAGPSVAARWIGSGLRSGRLTFSLEASAAGGYSMPVRFVLSAP